MLLSKSKYMAGLQCPLLLWYLVNEPGAVPPPDEGTQARFDTGHDIGDWAKKLYDGVEVPWGDFNRTLSKTKELIAAKKRVFEASFMASECYCRCDVLVPVDGGWDLIEVKSSTSVKEEHLLDVAFQQWVLGQAGVTVRRCHVMIVNNEYVRQGKIEPSKLLKLQDVTAETGMLLFNVPENVSRLLAVMRGPKPVVPIGPQCDAPYECPMKHKCWAFLPASNVTQLYRNKKLGWELLSEGVMDLSAIPEARLTGKNLIQREAVTTGKARIHREPLSKWLSKIAYPISYLDFESFNDAIPRFDGIKPYQQVVFQYSLHIDQSEKSASAAGPSPEQSATLHAAASLEHHEFLAETGDPRKEFLSRLKKDLPPTGSIVVYYKSFEISRLHELAAAFPEEKAWIETVLLRIVDLHEPFKEFLYYHPKQHGSTSIKSVLPALTGTDYRALAISDGESAAREYVRVTYGNVPEEERERVRKNLLEYCGLDTEAMVWILEKLLISVMKKPKGFDTG